MGERRRKPEVILLFLSAVAIVPAGRYTSKLHNGSAAYTRQVAARRVRLIKQDISARSPGSLTESFSNSFSPPSAVAR